MTRIETVGTYEHCGPDGSCFRPKGHDGGRVPRPILPEGILMPSVLRGPIPALPVTIPTPQEAQERPKTAGTGSGRGTGGREPHARPETVEEGRRIAVSMMDRAEAKWRHQHGHPHLREHCETCAEEHWTNRLRPGHYREAAADLRAYVAAQPPVAPDDPHACGHRDGIIWAAERLESYARDLNEAPSLPAPSSGEGP